MPSRSDSILDGERKMGWILQADDFTSALASSGANRKTGSIKQLNSVLICRGAISYMDVEQQLLRWCWYLVEQHQTPKMQGFEWMWVEELNQWPAGSSGLNGAVLKIIHLIWFLHCRKDFMSFECRDDGERNAIVLKLQLERVFGSTENWWGRN